MMQERQLREGVTPEEEAEETPYTADWEGIPHGYVLGPLIRQCFSCICFYIPNFIYCIQRLFRRNLPRV